MKVNPIIISRDLDGKQYFEIKYYDTELKDTVIGYGSFNREYVEKWLKEDFKRGVEVKATIWREYE